MKRLTRLWQFALAVLAIGALFAATPQAHAQSLNDIIGKGKLTVGILTDVPPFGIVDQQGKPDGYDADVAKLMGKYLGLPVDLVPLTGPNRIPYLLTGKVDVLVAVFGITPERAKQVMFSIPYSSLDIILIAAKSRQISKPEDLANLRISVARASTQDTALTAIAPKSATIQRFDDDATSVQAMISGQVDALGTNNIVAAQVIKQNPQLNLEKKLVLRRQFNGITVRQGAQDWLQWINTFLYFVKNNGELDAIHQKWFGEPLGDMPTF